MGDPWPHSLKAGSQCGVCGGYYLPMPGGSIYHKCVIGGDTFRERNDAMAVAKRYEDEASRLRAENERLREALKRYGTHEFDCDEQQCVTPMPCTCGLSAALAGAAP